MSTQPLTCPLTLDTLLAPNSLLCTTEGWPFQRGPVDPQVAECQGSICRPSPQARWGWSRVADEEKCAQRSCQEGCLVSTNSCCHRTRGTNGDAPKALLNLGGGWSAGAAQGRQGFRASMGALRGLPFSMAQAEMDTPLSNLHHPPTTTHASLSTGYEPVSPAGLSSQEWALESLSGGQRGRRRQRAVPRALKPSHHVLSPRAGKEPVR